MSSPPCNRPPICYITRMKNLFNSTLHKDALRRAREYRKLLAQGMTLTSIGARYGISRQRVHQVLARLRQK